MESTRDEKIAIVNDGLRLLLECKVPRFCPHADPDQLGQMQREWSERLSHLLPMLLELIEEHQETLFEEDWGPASREFQKYFVLIYFEQVSMLLESGLFQLNNEELEFRLAEFSTEVEDILTRDANSTIRSWLFHYYGCELGMEGWQCRPGDTYSLVRLFNFLLGFDREVHVHFGPKVQSFVENFGIQLLGYRQNLDYQMLGLILMGKVMKYTYRNGSCTNNAEEILNLVLQLTTKARHENNDKLWNVVYYSARSMRAPNPSLDDEVMRTLVSLLIDEDDMTTTITYMRTIIRMLLLDAPEVKLDGFEEELCTIFGRSCDRKEFRTHVKHRLQCEVSPRNRRLSIRWRFRIGQFIPKLFTRFATSSRKYLTRYCLQGLDILLWVTWFPFGQTWRQQCARAAMLCSFLDEFFATVKTLSEDLGRTTSEVDVQFLQDRLFLHDDLQAIFMTICDVAMELMCVWNIEKCPSRYQHQRETIRFQKSIISLMLRMRAGHCVLVSMVENLGRLITFVSCYSVKAGHVQQHNTLENGLLIAANVSIGHLRKHKYFYYIPRINSSPHNRKQRNSSSYGKADYDVDDSQRGNRPLPLELRRLRHISMPRASLLDQKQKPPPLNPKHEQPQQQKFQRYYIYSAAPRRQSLPTETEEIDGFMADKHQLFRTGTRPSSMKSSNGSHDGRYEDAATYRKMKKRSAADDELSKNITLILENLLKSYENSQMPTHGQGIPTIVKTNILIRSMGPVSELDMDYSMDCYFRQYWRDKRLSFRGPINSLSLSIKMVERIWRPDTYFYNGKHSHVHTITVPNKLLRLSQDGEILYSMRLTIKASCLMQLRSFPMDRQSCPLVLGSYAYSRQQLIYQWKDDDSVNFVPGLSLSQFDLMSFHQKNYTFARREGEFSVLHVSFNLQRHTGYFLIQVYVPCILIVVLSWVSFWIHREATSDRVGLGITTVLTLSTISLDSRTDLPKVRYATALDWFLLMNFIYCIATLLEFAGVHYFTKVGSGEIPLDEDEWEDIDNVVEIGLTISGTGGGGAMRSRTASIHDSPQRLMAARRRSSLICPIYNDPQHMFKATASHLSTMERTTQTEPPKEPRWKQLWLCFLGDDQFRRRRQREATGRGGASRHVNSVSLIDQAARVLFPASFTMFNVLYWLCYYTYQADFTWAPLKEV